MPSVSKSSEMVAIEMTISIVLLGSIDIPTAAEQRVNFDIYFRLIDNVQQPTEGKQFTTKHNCIASVFSIRFIIIEF